MLPYKTLIKFDRDSEMPVYVQISNSIINEIASGRISPDTQLPSSRKLSEILEVHRKTIVAAYDELEAQDWVYKKPSIGTFVINKIPEKQKIKYEKNQKSNPKSNTPTFNYDFEDFDNYTNLKNKYQAKYIFDDGYPDIRLAPLTALSREYSSIFKKPSLIKSLNYSKDFKGDYIFRLELTKYLRETRGIQADPENIIITRGSIMAFYLLFSATLKPKDTIVVGEPGFNALNTIVEMNKGNLISIPVDENGIDIDILEKILKKQKIKYVYVIPHHHHPTTVKLSPERRIRLLQLSEQYNFGILEDDYDFDFHYESSPVLPLASLNINDNVTYVGSFSKLIAPVLRLGFLVGSKELVDNLSKLRRYIDWKCDPILERAVCHMLKNGEMRRHLNKSLNAYRKRRNVLCDFLEKEMSDYVSFDRPEGGMALWTKFDPSIDLAKLSDQALINDVYISKPHIYFSKKNNINATRLGYASMNEKEIKRGLMKLKKLIKG